MGHLPRVEASTAIAGSVVIVTGSTLGIGLAVAQALVDRGAHVVINGRNPERVERVKREFAGRGIELSAVTADVSSEEGARRLIQETIARHGRFDVLINNAGDFGPRDEAWLIDADQFSETVRANLTGPFLCTREAVASLLETGRHGRVINVSSDMTVGPHPRFMPYTVTKSALDAMVSRFADDLPGGDIVVTGIALPGVQTARKFEIDWAHTTLLPPVESIIPAFEFALTAPAGVLHGRVFSAARFNDNPEREAAAVGPASARRQFIYPPTMIDGVTVERDPRHLALLDRFENPHGASPAAIDAIERSLTQRDPAYYPDERLTRLTGALAVEHNLDGGSFAIGPGSWTLIDRIVDVFVKPGEQVMSNAPGWFGFNLICARRQASQLRVPFDLESNRSRPSHDLSAVARAVTARTRLVYLVSPSNPEGVVLRDDELRWFLGAIPAGIPVVVDEAYAEFAADPRAADVRALVREGCDSLIGTRTFSKFHGLAGLRVGYAYARPAIGAILRDQELAFGVSHVAQVAAVAALGDAPHRRLIYEATRTARGAMLRGLTELGLQPVPTEAPFVLIAKPPNFERIVSELARKHVIIGGHRFYGDEMVTLPIGTQMQNAAIVTALRENS